jgi:hypothetical protein
MREPISDPRLPQSLPARSVAGRLHTPDIHWPGWIRDVERKRRQIDRAPRPMPWWIYRDSTVSSFKLEGLEASPLDVDAAARAADQTRRTLRSPGRQRIRNHLAVLLAIDRQLRRHVTLNIDFVVRSYTSLSGGLSTQQLTASAMRRIESAVRQINSPQLRLQPAVQEIAALHCELLNDDIFPSFNGIIARLLLRYHLGTCALPPVVFDPDADTDCFAGAQLLLPRLLQRVQETLARLSGI